MKKLAVILLSFILLACNQKEETTADTKVASSIESASTEAVGNEQVLIVGDAFNVTPEQFKERFSEYVNQALSVDDELTNLARGQIKIENMADGIKLAENHHISWTVNDKGLIKTVTETFEMRGHRDEHLGLIIPMLNISSAIGVSPDKNAVEVQAVTSIAMKGGAVVTDSGIEYEVVINEKPKPVHTFTVRVKQ